MRPLPAMRHLSTGATRALAFLTALIAAFVILLTLCAAPLPTAAQPTSTPAARESTLAVNTASASPAHTATREDAAQRLSGSRLGHESTPALVDARCADPTAGGGVWTRKDRARTRRQVDAIAREMGVDRATRRLLVRWAVRESNSRPHAVHVKPGDVRAATSPRSRATVAALGQTYSPAWGYGRGLYGMQPALYVGRWDSDAPPDVLCDQIVATVVAVWAAREQGAACERRGYPRTLLVANRRWGSGHCAPRAKDAIARAWWAARGRDIDVPARWGRKWRADTNRAEVYAHMRKIADES